MPAIARRWISKPSGADIGRTRREVRRAPSRMQPWPEETPLSTRSHFQRIVKTLPTYQTVDSGILNEICLSKTNFENETLIENVKRVIISALMCFKLTQNVRTDCIEIGWVKWVRLLIERDYFFDKALSFLPKKEREKELEKFHLSRNGILVQITAGW